MINRKVTVIAGSACLALVLSSCAESEREGGGGSEGGGSEGASDAQLVFGAAGAPTTFDPFYASDGETFRVTRQIFQNLIGIEEGGTKAVPELAKSWEGSDDGLTWTFELQDGVTFHDGTEFNAEAVCANFERWFDQNKTGQNDAVTAYWASDFGGFKGTDEESLYDSCEATEEMTAKVTVTRATGKFPIVLSQSSYGIHSPKAMEKYDANGVKTQGEGFVFPEYATDHPTGTGPFTFDSYDDANGTITLNRYNDFWGKKAGVKDLIFRVIADETSRRQELDAGTINGYDLPNPVDWGDLEDAGNQVLIRDPFNVLYLGINPAADKQLLDDDVRMALYMAINREELVKTQLPEGAEVATQFVPPTIDGYNDSLQPIKYDPKAAEKLLADAGKSNLTLDLWYPTEVTRPYLPDPQSIYNAIKADWEAIGVTINPVAKPWAGGYLDGVQQNNSPTYFLGWTGDYNGADNFLGSFFAGDDNDFGTVEYPWAQDLQDGLRAADEETDETKRTELYEELNADIMEWLPGFPISHSPPAIVIGPNVKGLTPSPLTNEDFSTVTITE